jgi:hypothetical protein
MAISEKNEKVPTENGVLTQEILEEARRNLERRDIPGEWDRHISMASHHLTLREAILERIRNKGWRHRLWVWYLTTLKTRRSDGDYDFNRFEDWVYETLIDRGYSKRMAICNDHPSIPEAERRRFLLGEFIE